MNAGREACIERTYNVKFIRMVTVSIGGFCPFLVIFHSTFVYANSVSRAVRSTAFLSLTL